MFWVNGSKHVEQKGGGAKVLPFAPQEMQNWAKSIRGAKTPYFAPLA
jgi:hypothetical protein